MKSFKTFRYTTVKIFGRLNNSRFHIMDKSEFVKNPLYHSNFIFSMSLFSYKNNLEDTKFHGDISTVIFLNITLNILSNESFHSKWFS